MKKRTAANVIMVVTLVFILGSAASVMAYRGGGGPGQGGWGCPGGGYGCKGDGPGAGWGMGNLSQEDAEKMNQLRQQFFEENEALRSQVRSKRFELQSEMVKENPDVAKAKSIQKELSDLEAQLDQKHIEHRIEMQKINPYAGRGYGMGFGPRGPRGGRGGFGGGYGGGCWR